MRPVSLSVLLLGIIYTFKVFDLIYVMTAGGPVDATTVLPIYDLQLTFEFFRFGEGAAAAHALLSGWSAWRSLPLAGPGARRWRHESDRGCGAVATAWTLIGVVLVAVYLFPVFWMVSTSLKTDADIYASPPKLIPQPTCVATPTPRPSSTTRGADGDPQQPHHQRRDDDR